MSERGRPPVDAELDGARATAFGRVFVLQQHLARLADAALEPLGLTSRQWLLLAVLARAFPGRAPSLTEAAAVYGSSRQNVKQVALGLEAKGYLRLLGDPTDARARRLHVTKQVAEFDSPAGQARAAELFRSAFPGLERDDVMALERLLGLWLHALAPTVDGPRTPEELIPTKETNP